MLPLLQAHWRKAALGLALIAAFAGGRFTTKPRVEVREQVRTVTVERVVERKVEVAAKAEVKRVVVYRERETKPDGTKVEREQEVSDTSTAETKTSSHERKETERQKLETKKESKVAANPDWRAGLLGGVDLTSREWLLGAHAERRLGGPFWIGAWGTHRGQVGVSLSLEF